MESLHRRTLGRFKAIGGVCEGSCFYPEKALPTGVPNNKRSFNSDAVVQRCIGSHLRRDKILSYPPFIAAPGLNHNPPLCLYSSFRSAVRP